MSVSRRGVLAGLAGGATTALAFGTPATAAAAPAAKAPRPLPRAPKVAAAKLAKDESYWARVARSYDVSTEVINLENGYFGVVPDVVAADFRARSEEIARRSSYYMRTEMGADWEKQRNRTAQVAGCDVSEVALTRGATEACQKLIAGYNKIGPGDVALYSDLDYDSMQYAMEWLKDRRGCTVVKGSVPEPATYENVLAYYEKLLNDNPKAKLLLLTHVSHRTGLLIPVREISEMAAKRGVDVILDAAHSWGQIDFEVRDLKVPFVAFNYHKWMGCPLGVGWMYIAKDRLADIDRDLADEDYPADDIQSRIHTGTANTANTLTISTALSFHEAVGIENKQARLRYLRDLWVKPSRELPRLQILTPDDTRMYGALTAFRVEGRTKKEDSTAIAKWLLEKHNIFTVRRGGVAAGEVIRVTPALYNTPDDSRRLAAALRELVKVF